VYNLPFYSIIADEIGSRYTKYLYNLPIKIIYNKKEKGFKEGT